MATTILSADLQILLNGPVFILRGRRGERFRYLCRSVHRSGDRFKQTADSALDTLIRFQPRSDIDEGDVDSDTVGQRDIMTVEPVGLADTAAHGDTVDGMAQALFGNRNEKTQRRVAAAAGIKTPNGAQRIGKRTVSVAVAAKELLDCDSGTKFFFLI